MQQQPSPSYPIKFIRTFAAQVRHFWDQPQAFGWLAIPENVRTGARNFAAVLTLWADNLASEQARISRRKHLTLLDNPQKSLAHPGPECECSPCMQNPDHL